jgi:micrococcal nuclease
MSRIGHLSGAARCGPTAWLAALVGLVSLLVLVPIAASPYDTRSLTAIVTQVVDGDTIHVRVNGRIEKVRYIGMDTPETKHPVRGEEPGGVQATALNRLLVLGKPVRLELDVRERDRHRRLLAYVYVGDTMVNAELVRLGYAHAMTVPPNVAHASRFVSLERQAREAGRGLWGRSQ